MALLQRIVVVGASLAGVRAAEALRRSGHDGSIVIVGAEKHRPYDRPPLSKQFLTGKADADAIALPIEEDLNADWMLGVKAEGLDLNSRRVRLQGGETVPYDGLVIATGAQPRNLPGFGGVEGVHLLRTLDDAIQLRAAIEAGGPIAVVGAGFIGGEIAASCRSLGLDVTVIEALDVPLKAAIGDTMGRRVAELHTANGTSLRLGVPVEGLAHGSGGRVEGVRLADGKLVPAAAVVVGVGVSPSVGWLEGSGVDLDNGVRCDSRCRVLSHGRPRPDVVAAGDVANWDDPLAGRPSRIEHWTNAVEQAEAAAATLLSGDEAEPYAPTPYFWSDQYKTKIQFVGTYRPGDEVGQLYGSIDDDRFVAGFGRDGRLVGAFGFSRPAKIMGYRRKIAEGTPWPVPAD